MRGQKQQRVLWRGLNLGVCVVGMTKGARVVNLSVWVCRCRTKVGL